MVRVGEFRESDDFIYELLRFDPIRMKVKILIHAELIGDKCVDLGCLGRIKNLSYYKILGHNVLKESKVKMEMPRFSNE
jgi:hypothetical protein